MATNLTGTTFSTTYKDDFTDSDNYHRILFNSGKLLQARELTQSQTLMQKQIERFGNNIFQEGAMVKAGGISVNNAYEFVKLDQTVNTLPADTSTIVGTEFTSQSADNTKFVVLQVVDATATDKATLYVRYTFTKDATAGATTLRIPAGVNISNGSTTLTVQTTNTAADPAVGTGTVVNVQKGIFYVKGHFVFTDNQSLIVSKYTDTFSGTIGFKVIEDVVSVTDDTGLYDNQGSVPNVAAPGADRYRIRLTLISKSNITGTENFVFLLQMQEGGVVRSVSESNPYNVPSQVMAQRIRENSGDYAIKQFKAKFEDDSANTHLLLKISDGVAVVDGYRVTRGPSSIRVEKALDQYTRTGQTVAASFGNFVKVSPGDSNTAGIPNLSTLEQLDIQDSAAFHGGSNAKIGTARVRAISEDGNDYRYHLFDIQMNSGKSFLNAKSIGSDSNNYFNIVQENNQANLFETEKNNLLFPLPNTRPGRITPIEITTQRYATATVTAKAGSLPGLSGNETFANVGDWIFAKNDSDVFKGSVTITSGGSGQQSAAFELDSARNGTYEVAYYVKDTSPTLATKTFVASANSGQINTAVSTNIDSDGNGLFSLGLGKADIFALTAIKDSPNGTENYLSRFTLDNGQRDNFYTEGRIVLKGGQTMPTTGVYVTFSHFTHTAGNYFAANSYDSSAIGGYEKIPTHTLADGSVISLADVLDFRPVKNSANGTFVGGDKLVHELPQPSDTTSFTGSYYLERSGKLVLTSEGFLEFIKGENGAPAISFPPTPAKTMALYDVILGANTLNDSDLLMQPVEQKRFTMKDISLLEKRIDRLEEATTLTLLEIDTKNIEVLDSSGVNRTRSGFVTDNFEDQRLSDTRNVDYSASIDPFSSILNPAFHEDNIRLIFDASNSSNVVKKGDNIYLDYVDSDFIDASKASTAIALNPFDFAQFRSTIKLSPSSDEWRDVETITGKVVDGGLQLDTKQAYLFNNHSWNWAGKEMEDLKVGSRTTNTKNGIFNKVVTDERIREVIGTRIVDAVLIPFMRQKKVYFKADGLRPNTQHFAFFDQSAISAFVREETFVRYVDDPTDYGNTKKNIAAHPEGSSILVSDSDGSIEGSFFIKAKTFRTGTREFHLLDVTAFNRDNASSKGVASFTSSGVIDVTEEDIISTRVLTIKQQKVPQKPIHGSSKGGSGGGGGKPPTTTNVKTTVTQPNNYVFIRGAPNIDMRSTRYT